MVLVYYWVDHQGRQSFVPDICCVIPTIKSDRAGQPGVDPRGDGLYSACVSERAFAPSRGYVSRVDHVYYFYLWREFFLSPSVWLARLILVSTWCFPSLVFGI